MPRPVSHKFDYLKGGKGTTERSRAIRTNSAPIAPTAGPSDPRSLVPSLTFTAPDGAPESRPLTTLVAPTRPPPKGGQRPQAKKSTAHAEDTSENAVAGRRSGSAKSPILLNSSGGEQSSGDEESSSDDHDSLSDTDESGDDDEPQPRRDRNRRANPRKRRRR